MANPAIGTSLNEHSRATGRAPRGAPHPWDHTRGKRRGCAMYAWGSQLVGKIQTALLQGLETSKIPQGARSHVGLFSNTERRKHTVKNSFWIAIAQNFVESTTGEQQSLTHQLIGTVFLLSEYLSVLQRSYGFIDRGPV